MSAAAEASGRSRQRWRRGMIVPAILLAGWAATSSVPSLHAVAAPQVLRAFGELAHDRLWTDMAATLTRFFLGLLIGSAVGVPIGFAMGSSRVLDRLIGPLLHPLRQIPLFGWIPLIGLWFGLGELPKVVFIALAVSYVMVLNTYEGVRGEPAALREVARAHRLGWLATLWLLTLPAALPAIFSGLRISVAIAWSAAFGAEIMLAAGSGIGSMIWGARELGRTDIVVAGTLVIALLGIVANLLLNRADARLFRWRGETRR
jgi:sulfonate transport system permease protein